MSRQAAVETATHNTVAVRLAISTVVLNAMLFVESRGVDEVRLELANRRVAGKYLFDLVALEERLICEANAARQSVNDSSRAVVAALHSAQSAAERTTMTYTSP